MTNDPAAIRALEHLRAHREGVLIADGLASRIRFVIDSVTGRIVFPTTTPVAEAAELVLFVPEEDPVGTPELQLLLTARPLDPSADPACDRWEAYHGEPRLTRWAACSIDSVKFAGEVADGEIFNRASMLRKAEPALCRLLNADPARLSALCAAKAGVLPREPRAVGVDELGADVRARFGIVRIPFPRPATDQQDAENLVRGLLEQSHP
jgi:hypothetical protein